MRLLARLLTHGFFVAALIGPGFLATNVAAQCSNCSTTSVSGDVLHVFTSGTGSVTLPAGSSNLRYLVVAGGGGGGTGGRINFFGAVSIGGGGGGAGGVRSGMLASPTGTFNVVVGAGGSEASNGADSVFGSVTAVGGGAGGVALQDGQPGGSGGGGGAGGGGANGVAGQGNPGGDAGFLSAIGGGGGGATSAGSAGAGGAGLASSLSGNSTLYAAGGSGGGFSGTNGVAGAQDSGNGGGGGIGLGASGGAGGSGIVIVRYTPPPTRYAVQNGNWNSSSTWSYNGCNGTGGASPPTAVSDVVICNDRSVTIAGAAVARSVTLESGNQDVNLVHSAGASLTVGAGGVTLAGATNGNNTKTWNLGDGSAVVNGPVILQGGSNDNRRVRIELASGSLDINGNLSYNSNNTDRAVIEATGTATISLSGTFTITGGSASLIPGTASTFIYDGGAQVAPIGVSNINYHHLTFAGSGVKTQSTSNWWRAITGNTTVNTGVTFINSASLSYEGDFVNNGTTDATAAQIYNGNFINRGVYTASAAQQYRADFANSGTFNAGGSNHSFNGTTVQEISGATTFGTLTIDNSAGLTLADDVTTQSQLLLNNGVVNTGDNVLRAAQTYDIARSNGWVAGHLGVWLPTGYQGRNLPIGDAAAYRPISLVLPNVTSAGYVVAHISQNPGDHPQIASSTIDASRSVNRWWSITSEGAAAGSISATFNFLPGDVDGGANPQAFAIQRVSGGGWTDVAVGTRTATSTEGSGIAGFGEFAIGESGATSSLLPVAEWHFDEDEWTGTAGEVIDSSGNGMHGTANGGATTASASPAISGDPGTCGYGVFDGVDDRVEVGSISSTLNATASMAFWIKTAAGYSGSDTVWEAPAVAGVELAGGTNDIFWGWIDGSGRIGISVGNDNTSRSNTTINNGGWHHVVLTRDETAGHFKIYIDGVLDEEGAIDTGVITSTYSSIGAVRSTDGGHTYLEAELDEVQIYSGVLSNADVTTIMQETHPCSAGLCPSGAAQGGLIGDYYDGTNFSGSPVGSQLDGPIDFNWANGSPGVGGTGTDQFSIEWNGFVHVTETGQYRFQTVSDDGVRLTLDGQVIIQRWNDHARETDTSNTLTLTAGEIYPVRLQYYENGGQAEVRLRWQTPSSGGFVPVPAGPLPVGSGLYSCTNESVSYYGISHSEVGITCEAEKITVSAYDSAGNLFAPPAGTTIALSTTPDSGTWVGGNTHVFTGTETSVEKFLRQLTPATLNINVTDGAVSEIATMDRPIVFSDAAVRFYGDTNRAELPSQVAGVLDSNIVLAVVQTNSETGTCERADTDPRNVSLGFECRNPSTCNGGALSLADTSVAANDGTAIDGGAVPALTAMSLTFDSEGFAQIPLQYSDVGSVRLHGTVLLPEEGEHPEKTVVGSSDAFVVKPHTLRVTTVNPPANAAGPGFATAGQEFTVQLEAQNRQGNRTPNFGRENTPAALMVDWSTVYPSGGIDGMLSGNTSFSAVPGMPGRFENVALSWDEVGEIELTPRLLGDDYLGAGNVIQQPPTVAGRFYPHYFELTGDAVTAACVPPVGQSFSYFGHDDIDVEYTLNARSVTGGAVQNYDNASRGFDTFTPEHSVLQTMSELEEDDDQRLFVDDVKWQDGRWEMDDKTVTFLREAQSQESGEVLSPLPEDPLPDLQLSVVTANSDIPLVRNSADLISCSAAPDCDELTVGAPMELRFGRLRLDDAFGPETADMPVRFYTEWWNGSEFVINTDDSCTQVPLAAVAYPGGTIENSANRTVAIGSGSTTGQYGTLTPDNIIFDRGDAEHLFTAPGAGNQDSFQVRVDLSALPWLRYAWDQATTCNTADPDGDACFDTELPAANFTFGSYRGHDRIIYWREVLD